MRLKDYSMRLKKNIAVLLHIMFLTLALASISVMYLNTQIGSGLSWLRDRKYEDSPQFQEQFQSDLDLIFDYVAYRDVFETDGKLDVSKEMFAVSRGDNPEIVYTLEEVLRYAKSQGYYLNDQFQVVNDLYIYDNVSTTKDQLVKWRAYDPDATLSEPGDAYTSLLALSREVLDCLSEYYTVYYRMLANPSNLYFQILYESDDGDQIRYSNAEELSLEELRSKGRYCFLSSDSIFIETNLEAVPKNLSVSMEKNNLYDAENYYMIASIDTHYAADDIYAQLASDYQHLRGRFLEALLALAVGIIGCLITLYYLVVVSGYRTEDRVNPYLHGFDMITTESCIVMTAICTLFMLFLGEKVGYLLIHLLIQETSWPFAERMLRAVIIYTCCMVSAFSLLRRYKSRQLWENSILHHVQQNFELYFADRTFSHRLACLYVGFAAAQIVVIGLIAVLFRLRHYPAALLLILVLFIGLIVLDYRTFHSLFVKSKQEDQIADAIAKIAGGDTSYQMDLNGLRGKELHLGTMINSIGVGLEQALQEQVRSERLKANLITNVSHDIKTPLTSIINYVDLLKRENLPGEKTQEYLKVLDQKSQRLKNLTEDLVEASKASSGNVKLDVITLDLVEMIWQTNGEFEEKFATRHLELVSSLPDGSLLIDADGRHLWRVLENIYNNAFKYAMEHSRVYTELTREQDYAHFTIKNVSESPLNVKADELTERFVRGDVSRTTEGSGLGLSIAESLTKLQGGTFQILIDGDLFKVRIGFPVKIISSERPEEAQA
ncbi:MAG: HAMP domain-containing sensor histidine kinase [Lachnospiraceae bacterium]|nr:HAMP domain-containing sensor histidine kinase [Lachnospiraceae bacterium]